MRGRRCSSTDEVVLTEMEKTNDPRMKQFIQERPAQEFAAKVVAKLQERLRKGCVQSEYFTLQASCLFCSP